MNPTLDQILSFPTDPDLLRQRLQNLGHLPPPPAAVPLVPPATVGPLSPVTPHSDVAPMTPPAVSERGTMTPLLGRSREIALGATSEPVKPMAKPENIGVTPDIGTAAPSFGAGMLPAIPSPHAVTPKESITAGMEQHGTTSKEEGRRQFEELRPQITASPGSSDFYRQQIAQAEFDKAHPWGGDISAHPGLLGKIGHVAGEIGQVAGVAINPNIVTEIPGTRLNRAMKEAGATEELGKAETQERAAKTAESEAELRGAQTKEAEAKLAKEGTEQTLEKDAEGNVTGWRDGQGRLHSLTEEGTPQAIKDIAASTSNKPHFEKTATGDIVQVTPGKNGETATSEVVYKGDPKIETDLTTKTVNGEEHHVLVNKKDGELIKDLGAFKQELSPSGQLAKEKAGEALVLAHDDSGRSYLTSRADAEARGLKRITASSVGELDKAGTHAVTLNDMQAKLNAVVDSSKALDQNIFQRGIIARCLAHPGNGVVDSSVRAIALSGATELTKDFVMSAISLRESGLALPKELTGGSRVTEIQAEAMWATLPDASSLNSKYAIKQAKMFQQNLDRLWKRVPEVEGVPHERSNLPAEGGDRGPAGPPGPPAPGMKWQQNKKTGEYRQTKAE